MPCCCRLEKFSEILEAGAQIFILPHGALHMRTHRLFPSKVPVKGPYHPFHRGDKMISFIRSHTRRNLITKPGAGVRASF